MESDQRLTPLPALSAPLSDPNYLPSYTYIDAQDNKRSIRHYFAIIYKRLPLILVVTIIVTAITALYLYRQPLIYQAQARIIIEPRKPQVTLKDAVSISLSDDQKYYKTQFQLLQDPELLKRAVISLGLYRDANLFKDQNRGVLGGLGSIFPGGKVERGEQNTLPVIGEKAAGDEKNAAAQLTPEDNDRARAYVKIILNAYKVEQVDGTNIISVNVRDSNPELATSIAYKVAELFIEEDAELETAGAQKAYKDLGNSIEELKLTIAKQEADLIEYMRSSGLPLQEKGQDLTADRLGQISETWVKAMENRRQIEARYNAAIVASNHGQGMNIPDLYENKIFQDTMRLNTERRAKLQDQIRDIEKEIKDAETQKAELLVTYTPEYRKVREQEQKIESLKTAKARTETEISKIIDLDQKRIEKDAVSGALVALRSQLNASRTQESESQAAYDREAARANIQGQIQTKLTTLKREIETNRNLLDTYTQRQKEQELALATGRPNNIKIQNRVGPPDEPLDPQRLRNIIVAIILSLAAGIGLAFLLDFLDDSVRTSDDVSRHSGLPTLAVIPYYARTERRKLPLATKNDFGNAALVSMVERNSPMAEAYRHLRTSLLFSSAGTPPKTILITSTAQSEGKTTTAVNTAITLAQSGADVVIIDCDLRRPRLHNHFGLENTRGLTNYLSGDNGAADLIRTCEGAHGLKIITSGPIPPNPAELLSSNEMQDLLGVLSGRFKHVIIDSPPAISFADASILSTLVDGVVLVTMANKSSIHLMRQFKQREDNIGAHIYGVVLNGLKADSTEYYYYDPGYYANESS